MTREISAWTLVWRTIYFNFQRWKANRLHHLTGKQYHIVPVGKRKYKIVNNRWVKAYNNIIRKSSKTLDHYDILLLAAYSTKTKR